MQLKNGLFLVFFKVTSLKSLSSCKVYSVCFLHFSSVQFSRSVMSDSLQPHESQHARPPCPSPTPGVHSDSCPSSQWCHPAISSCRPLFLLPPIPPSIRVFSNESTLCMRWIIACCLLPEMPYDTPMKKWDSIYKWVRNVLNTETTESLDGCFFLLLIR